jgi:hypothetical protein
VLDWHRFSVRIPPHRIPELPDLLRAIPAATVRQMQARLREVKRRFLLFPFASALALIELRVAALLNASSGKGGGAAVVATQGDGHGVGGGQLTGIHDPGLV